jgi:hypothetical protein
MGEAHVRVVLEEKARVGLADEVRKQIPGVVDVALERRDEARARRRVRGSVGRRGSCSLEYLDREGADRRSSPSSTSCSTRCHEAGLVHLVRLHRVPVTDRHRLLEGADLFALTGPTGSGKSSIIDAICFALYGSIPG